MEVAIDFDFNYATLYTHYEKIIQIKIIRIKVSS